MNSANSIFKILEGSSQRTDITFTKSYWPKDVLTFDATNAPFGTSTVKLSYENSGDPNGVVTSSTFKLEIKTTLPIVSTYTNSVLSSSYSYVSDNVKDGLLGDP